MLLRSYEKYSNLVSGTSNAMLHQLSFIENLADLTDSLAAILPFSIELKKKYLYEEDPIKRAISLLEQLKGRNSSYFRAFNCIFPAEAAGGGGGRGDGRKSPGLVLKSI